jgi:hypothetical protein
MACTHAAFADAKGCVLDCEVELAADPLGDGAFGGVGVKHHLAAGKCRRIDPPERHIGIGHGRLAAAALVAHRAGLRARAARTDGDASERVDAGNRAAAGADLHHLDHRNAQRQP